MLWVTMAIVYCDFSSSMSSSTLAVEMGSSAEQGSSNRMTSGFTATDARDAQALLLAAGEAETGGVELVLYLIPQRGAAERRLDASVHLALRGRSS